MKLDLLFEEKQEFKTSLSELDKGLLSLSAMLNKNGEGEVFFGVRNDGEILGLKNEVGEETIKKISSRCDELIKPSILFTISPLIFEDKIIISLKAKGNKKPYSCGGNYRVREGSENKKIDPELLGEIFFSSQNNALENIESINQNLTFMKLKFLYMNEGLSINNDNFEENMNLRINGKYNMLANLLADENDVSIKVVRFIGKDKSKMLIRNEYGYKCLLIAMKEANDYVLSLNETRVDITSSLKREEKKLFDIHAFEEAWTNACLHNKWVRNVPPAIYIYEDRIEIISCGGLPFDYSKEDFYKGISRPVNIGLLKIMGQLNLVEQTGHGNLIIIGKYGREAFDIENNYILVTIPFAFTPSMKEADFSDLNTSQEKVLKIIKDNPLLNIKEIANLSEFSVSRTNQIISELKNMNKLKRVGANKNGYWEVVFNKKN